MLSVFEKEFEYDTVKIIKSEFHGFMLCPWFIHKKVNQSIGKCDYVVSAYSGRDQDRIFHHVSGGGSGSGVVC